MKFEYQSFSCDVDLFYRNNDIIVRFYDSYQEQSEEEIRDLVIVSPGYGYLLFKAKGEVGLLSGFLDESIFFSDDLVEAAIDFSSSKDGRYSLITLLEKAKDGISGKTGTTIR